MNIVNKTTGLTGENIASNFLLKKGFSILDKNFKLKFGEIDLVAKKGNTIHIVEVKTKTSSYKGAPYQQVDYKKLKKLIALSFIYTKYKKLKDLNLSIDIVSIVLNNNTSEYDIKFYENITN